VNLQGSPCRIAGADRPVEVDLPTRAHVPSLWIRLRMRTAPLNFHTA
jgi:hypothetical protein